MDTNIENPQVIGLLKTTQAVFYLNAMIWLVFSVLSFVRAYTTSNDLHWMLSVLMLANAGFMFGFGYVIIKGHRWTFFLAILYVAVNVVLSITDQFGWFDFLIMLLNLVLLGLLFVTRQWMNQAS